MNTDAKDVTRRFYEEIINQKNIHAIDRFCTTDFVDHNPPPGGEGSLDATKQQFLELVAAFPDLKMMVQDQIAEGDKVVNRVLVRGTHKGEYIGIPGSGNMVEIGGIDILRMVNGKAAERWGYFDDVKLMQQLGAMPGPKHKHLVRGSRCRPDARHRGACKYADGSGSRSSWLRARIGASALLGLRRRIE
jgi:steroid delta-isomerase-like uncharacterized protein